jgi:NADP-dependent 3-hydroxy acid dehydrogenase YdfG
MLEGKVAVISGASSGIGYSTALTLSKSGAKVVAGARRIDRLEKLRKEITAQNGNIIIKKLDVTKKEECKNFVNYALEEYKKVDILINDAGVMPLGFIKNVNIEEWDQMIDVNLRGVLYCTAAVVPHMIERGTGHIVNMSSLAGRIVFPSGSVYCATKHAVSAFSEGLRQELSQRFNIKVTYIEPGIVDTELFNNISDPSLHGFLESLNRSEKLHAQDIADAILYTLTAATHVNINDILIRHLHSKI